MMHLPVRHQATANAVGVVSNSQDGPWSPNINAEITPKEAHMLRLVTYEWKTKNNRILVRIIKHNKQR